MGHLTTRVEAGRLIGVFEPFRPFEAPTETSGKDADGRTHQGTAHNVARIVNTEQDPRTRNRTC